MSWVHLKPWNLKLKMIVNLSSGNADIEPMKNNISSLDDTSSFPVDTDIDGDDWSIAKNFSMLIEICLKLYLITLREDLMRSFQDILNLKRSKISS